MARDRRPHGSGSSYHGDRLGVKGVPKPFEMVSGPLKASTLWGGGERVRSMSDYQVFTEGSRRVLTGADEEARRLKHNYVGTEHILLAL